MYLVWFTHISDNAASASNYHTASTVVTSFNAKDEPLQNKSSQHGKEALNRHGTNLSATATFKKTNVMRKQNRMFKLSPWVMRTFVTSCIMLLILLFSYIPIIVLFMHEKINGMKMFPVRGLLIAMPILSSIINPVIYLWRIREFRKSLKYRCKCSAYRS